MSRDSILLWQMIANDLEAKIASGELAPGARLQTENELAKRYAVNRHTVRRAIRELVMQNQVEVTQGRGSFVCRPQISINLSADFYAPMSVQLIAVKSESRRENAVRVEPAMPQMAKALQINTADSVAMMEFTIKSTQEELLGFTVRTVPLERTSGVLDLFQNTGCLPRALQQIDISQIKRKWILARSRAASAEERTTLGMAHHTPVIIVDRLFVDPQGQPIVHDCFLFAADRVIVYC